MTDRELYEAMSIADLREELAEREIEVEPGSGSGKDGRVLKVDIIEVLLADDAGGAEKVVDEAGDAVEPAEAEVVFDRLESPFGPEGPVVRLGAPVPPSPAEPNDEVEFVVGKKGPEWPDHEAYNELQAKTATDDGTKIGDVVTYRDKFSGSAGDARVSGIVDAATGVVNLAVFRGGGSAHRREAVPRGRTSGTWEPKGAA